MRRKGMLQGLALTFCSAHFTSAAYEYSHAAFTSPQHIRLDLLMRPASTAPRHHRHQSPDRLLVPAPMPAFKPPPFRFLGGGWYWHLSTWSGCSCFTCIYVAGAGVRTLTAIAYTRPVAFGTAVACRCRDAVAALFAAT